MSTQVEERVSRVALRRKRARRSFGLSGVEIGAAILALLAFVLAVFYYFTALSPEQTRLRAQEHELQRINDELAKVSTTGGGAKGPNVRDALASLQSFKTEYLRPLSSGRIALINEVNALGKKHGVTLTSGIDMPLEKGAAKTEDDSKRKKRVEEVLNAFPRLDMHFTVFGQYPNLRAFLNDLEHNKQFFVVKSVGFVMQEDKGGGEGGGSRHHGRATGSGLAMTIEAAAYFQP
jgi:hypothetical protein